MPAERYFARFAIVGGLNTMWGFGFFPLMYWLASSWLNVNVILGISYIVCPIVSFSMHKRFTFASKGNTGAEGTRYIVVTGITWAVNALLLNLVLWYTSVGAIQAQLALALLLQLANYFLYRHFVFGISSADQPMTSS